MKLKVTHKTIYDYDTPVPYGLQQVRLTPKSRAGQTVLCWEMKIEGGQSELVFDDQNNNHTMLVSHHDGSTCISVSCKGEVETTDRSGIIGEHGGFAPLWYFQRPTELTMPGPGVRGVVNALGNEFDGDISRMHALSELISSAISYQSGKTGPQTTAEDALSAGHGVCQDHAHAFLSAARLLSYPARYVSGYLMMDDRVDQDASHAWAEVHCDGIGWVGFDISNGISPDERYIRVATGLDYRDAAPISGMRMGGSDETMRVKIQVQQ